MVPSTTKPAVGAAAIVNGIPGKLKAPAVVRGGTRGGKERPGGVPEAVDEAIPARRLVGYGMKLPA